MCAGVANIASSRWGFVFSMSGFVSRNKPDWEELARLVKKARKSIRQMTPEELIRLDILYRRTTIHLSQVATRTTDAKLRSYLNGLAASAHSLIYLPPRKSLWKGALGFVSEGFSRLIVRCWRYHTVSVVLMLGGGLLAYFASMSDPLAAYALLPPGDIRLPGSTQEQLLDVLRSGRETGGGGKFLFASFLFSHNLKVGMLAMGMGVLAAIPTTMLMIYNGMLLGSFTAIHHKAGIYAEFWAWILPHGITEIGAIILCGGVGFLLGKAVVSPGLTTRAESLRKAGVDASLTCVGVAGMLVLAAIIESYLRQSHLSTTARLWFATATGNFWILFFAHGFVRERAERVKSLTEDSADAAL